MAAMQVHGQFFPKTGGTTSDRATYEQWSNLIYRINLLCEMTHYGYTNIGVSPMTNILSVFKVAPTNYLDDWSVSVGLGWKDTVQVTNVSGSEITTWTNFMAGSVPVRFTNMVGTLTESRYGEWLENMTNWTFEAVHLPITVTNVAMSAQNAYELDNRLRSLIPYFVDMREIEDAGGFSDYFARQISNSYPDTVPLMTISNAWRYAGLPVRYNEDLNGDTTNRSWQYLFSLAPSVEVFQVQLASMTLLETNRVVTTNVTVVAGTTNVEIEIGKDLAWKQDPYIFDERLKDGYPENDLIYSQPSSNAVVYAQMVLAKTGTWENSPVGISVTGIVFSSSTGHVSAIELVSIDSETRFPLSNAFLRVQSMFTSNGVHEVEYIPGRSNEPPYATSEGSTISIYWSNSYYRLKSIESPTAYRRSRVEEHFPTASSLFYKERLAIVTQLTHIAVFIEPRYFTESIADPIPLLTSPSTSFTNGYVDLERHPDSYDLIGGANPDDYLFSGTIRSFRNGFIASYEDSFTNKPFFGFEAKLHLNEYDYPYTNYVDVSTVSSEIIWAWETEPGISLDKSEIITQSSVVIFNPFGLPGGESSVETNIFKVFGPPYVRAMWPRTLDISMTNLSTNVTATAHLFAKILTTSRATNEAGQLSSGIEITDYSTSLCSEAYTAVVFAVDESPIIALPTDYYSSYGEAGIVSNGVVSFTGIDFNNGVFPDDSWITTDTVTGEPCEVDIGTDGVVTSGQGVVYYDEGTITRQIITHINYSRFPNLRRSLAGAWIIFDHGFSSNTLIMDEF